MILIIQTSAPFDFKNTLIPIMIFLLFLLYDITIHGVKNANPKPLKKGVLLMLVGFVCFIKGLDRDNDYLRLFHSLWHLIIGFSTYFVWQGRDREEDQIGYFEILKIPLNTPMNYFGKEKQLNILSKKKYQ